MNEVNEAIILAGGLGTRLQSVVKDVPKAMAEVAGKPFLYYLFRYLEKQKIDRIILSLGYKSDVVTDWMKNSSFPFKIDFVVEDAPLGTGGAINYALTKSVASQVFVINGDTFFNVDLSSFYTFHQDKKADISLALKPMNSFDRYGSVALDGNGRIVQFNEKQFCESGLINGGIYLINKEVFNGMELSRHFSFEKDILENKSLGLNISGYVEDAYFIDIGIPDDFEKANTDFVNFGK